MRYSFSRRSRSRVSPRLKRLENLARGELKSKTFSVEKSATVLSTVNQRTAYTDIAFQLTRGVDGDDFTGRELSIKSIEVIVWHSHPDVYCALTVPYNAGSTLTFNSVFDPPNLTDSAGAFFPHLRIDEANFGWVLDDSTPKTSRTGAVSQMFKLRKNFRIPMKVKFDNQMVCQKNRPYLIMTHLAAPPVYTTWMHACITVKYYDK